MDPVPSWSPEPGPKALMGVAPVNDTDHAYSLDDYPAQLVILVAILCPIAVFGIAGNIPVFLAVVSSPKLQTVTNAFIASLSVCSFVTCLTIPYHVTTILGDSPPRHGGCVLVSGMLISAQISSILTLTLIAVNRVSMMRGSNPFYRKLFSKTNAGIMIAVSWALPMMVLALVAGVGFVTLGYNEKYKICIVQSDSSTAASLVAGVVIGFPSLTVIVVCYIFIFKFTRHHHTEVKRGLSRDALRSSCDYLDEPQLPSGDELDEEPTSRKKTTSLHRLSSFHALSKELSQVRGSFADREPNIDRRKSATEKLLSRRQHKISRNLFFIVCVFVVLVMPFCLAIVIPNSDAYIMWFGVLLLSNSAINPVLYGFLHPQFKEAFKCLPKCHRMKAVQDMSGLYGRLTSFTSHNQNKRTSAAV